jgi:hypothetical protein
MDEDWAFDDAFDDELEDGQVLHVDVVIVPEVDSGDPAPGGLGQTGQLGYAPQTPMEATMAETITQHIEAIEKAASRKTLFRPVEGMPDRSKEEDAATLLEIASALRKLEDGIVALERRGQA